MTTVAYQTLYDGSLLDFEFDDEQRELVLRAGTSLTPAERPVILRLSLEDISRFQDNLIGVLGLGLPPVTITVTAHDSESLQPTLYDIAREITHSLGVAWTDPRTGVTHDPPDDVKPIDGH